MLCTNKDDENMRGLLLTLLLVAAAGTYAEYLMQRSVVQWEDVGESGISQELKLGSGAENVPVMLEVPSSGDGLSTLRTEGGGGAGSGSGSGGPPFINVVYNDGAIICRRCCDMCLSML